MKTAVRSLVIGIFFLGANLFGGLSRQLASYDIKARLIPESRTIEATGTLTWTNDSGAPVSELRFHLYMNAFKNNRTTFMTRERRRHRGYKAGKDDWGWIDVRRIGIKDGADLTPDHGVHPARRREPGRPDGDEGRPARPVKPGERIVLASPSPPSCPRSSPGPGFSGEFYMAGQWFPKIGVLWTGAWNCHQYHANSEFFADFGSYRVEITVPERFVVGATGKRTRSARTRMPAGPTCTPRTISTTSPGRPAPTSSRAGSASCWTNRPWTRR